MTSCLRSTNLPFSQRGVPRSGEGFGEKRELATNPSELRSRPLEHKGTLLGRGNEVGCKKSTSCLRVLLYESPL